MRVHTVKALTLRNIRATFTDKGRVSEILVFPVSFLVIWGLFYASGIAEVHLASQLLVINLIWSIAGTFQTQANLMLMFDLWSREFAQILRQGVRIEEMFVSHIIFSTTLGILNLLVFLFFIVYSFGGGMTEIRMFTELLPLYALSSIGLALMFGGFVLYLGRSYAFISWTGLQILIMLSSPFSPISTLPGWLQKLVLVSPFTFVFEYVRFGRVADYIAGLILSIIYLFLGTFCAYFFYNKRRKTKGLMEV
ncbi:MAG: ABC transporter permease [Deltaproteobacteria bacterium]|nr:ABC transporter permease [Deltaproteobacteria bacterium]